MRAVSEGFKGEGSHGKKLVLLPLLQVIAKKLRLSGDFNFGIVAAKTPGFAGADLHALTKEAAAIAVSRILSSLGRSGSSTLEQRQVRGQPVHSQ